jgi:hypothetical protein
MEHCESIAMRYVERAAKRELSRLNEEAEFFLKMGYQPEDLTIVIYPVMSGIPSTICPRSCVPCPCPAVAAT